MVIATKGGITRPEERWEHNGSPSYLKKACELSLKALKIESIDLYQLHIPYVKVPFLESLSAFIEIANSVLHFHISALGDAEGN